MSSLAPTLWSYFTQYARSSILKSFEEGIINGRLTIIEESGTLEFGHGIEKTCKTAVIHVKDAMFWTRIFQWHDLGFAEAFMREDFVTPSLKDIFDLWLDNRQSLQGLSSLHHRAFAAISAITIRYFSQSPSQSLIHAVTGYDCSNDFFEKFLSEDMTYSSALWPDELGGVRGDLEGDESGCALQAAQLHKIKKLLKLTRVGPGDRLLEFGSGWGAMSMQAAKLGCKVDTITLSVEQKKFAEKRIAEAGLQEKITVHLLDYRNLPASFEHCFDALISVEMVEAVGVKYLPEYFKIIDWALKPNKGVAVVTSTTQPEDRFAVYQALDYSRYYQWPNSFLPSATCFVSIAEAATKGKLSLETVNDYGTHYPRTLREWKRRLLKNWNSDLEETLVKRHPELAYSNNLGAFRRKWEYMCDYSEVGYSRAYTTMHYFSFVRPECVRSRCD